jgi:amino acid transporter
MSIRVGEGACGDAAIVDGQTAHGNALHRALTFPDLVIYGMVFMLPTAPFSLFGIVHRASNGHVPLAYLLGAIVMAFTARSYGLLSKRIPLAGSVYTYTRMGIGETAGFIAGWLILLDYIIAPGLMYVISAASLHDLVPAIERWQWVVIFTVIGTGMNIVGIKIAAKANALMLLGMLVILAIFLVCGAIALSSGHGNGSLTARSIYSPEHFSWHAIGTAILISSTNFLGFDAITTLGEEVLPNRRHLLGLAGLTTLAIIVALFFIQTWVASDLLPGVHVHDDDTAFYDIAEAAGGRWLRVATSLTTALSFGIACAIVCQSAIARILFAMARDRQLPHVLARIHPKTHQPYVANLLVGAVSLQLALIFQNRIEDLALFQNFGALSAFCFVNVAVIGYFWVKLQERAIWSHLVIPAIGLMITMVLLSAMRVATLTLGASWLAIGVGYLVVMRLVLHRSVSLKT